jgi:hypothetical protein
MVVVAGVTGSTHVAEAGEAAARRALRAQIARLERELADALASAFPITALDVRVPGPARRGPRLLTLGELEIQRDALHERLRTARVRLEERGREEERARALLERMLLEPARHRGVRVRRADLGERGCGAWEVRPRLGLIGMLTGWWQVKLSSGCPLAT